MKFPDRLTINVLLTTLLFFVGLFIVYVSRHILVIFFLAILFAYLLEPLARFLQRHSLVFRNVRGPAVVEVYLALLVSIALVIHAVAPTVLTKARKAFDEVPVLLDDLPTGEIASKIGNTYGWSEAQEHRLKAFLAGHREEIQSLVKSGERYTAGAPQAIASLLLIPILAIFFLIDGGHIANAVINLASDDGRYRTVLLVADEINHTLKRYIRGKVILGGLSMVFYSGAMLLLGFPHPFALGFLGGCLEFVPVAGWLISAASITGVGVLTHSHWISMALLLGIWRLVQDYYSAPRVMGHQLEVHPLLAILAVLVGWEIDGIVGIYLMVPLVAAIRAVWRMRTPRTSNSQDAPQLVHRSLSESAN